METPGWNMNPAEYITKFRLERKNILTTVNKPKTEGLVKVEGADSGTGNPQLEVLVVPSKPILLLDDSHLSMTNQKEKGRDIQAVAASQHTQFLAKVASLPALSASNAGALSDA